MARSKDFFEPSTDQDFHRIPESSPLDDDLYSGRVFDYTKNFNENLSLDHSFHRNHKDYIDRFIPEDNLPLYMSPESDGASYAKTLDMINAIIFKKPRQLVGVEVPAEGELTSEHAQVAADIFDRLSNPIAPEFRHTERDVLGLYSRKPQSTHYVGNLQPVSKVNLGLPDEYYGGDMFSSRVELQPKRNVFIYDTDAIASEKIRSTTMNLGILSVSAVDERELALQDIVDYLAQRPAGPEI